MTRQLKESKYVRRLFEGYAGFIQEDAPTE
jgi:hypothetical protein